MIVFFSLEKRTTSSGWYMFVYPSNSLPEAHVHVQAGNRNQAKMGTNNPLDRSDQVS